MPGDADTAALEEQRDFLLRSLADLDRELEAGDIEEDDHRTLTADYTARAAAVIRALEADDTVGPAPGTAPGRRALPVLAVLGLAALAGVLVMQASGRRGSSGPTGLDVAAASSRIDDCQQLEQGGDPDAALDCYTGILESLPANVPALTFRGWLQVREFDVDAGIEDLDAAIQLDDETTAPYIFRASGNARRGDLRGAAADLAAFYEHAPTDEERGLADQFAAPIVDGALDECIAGDVDGGIAPVEVLQCYRDVLTVDPGNATASVYLGWLLARSGLPDEALDLLDVGLASDPSLSAGYVFRAAVRAHAGDRSGALADLETFDGMDAPADQVAAAQQVRDQVEAGQDPLA